ncbi:MAG: right-handed parallel beta-helix repeat-containing protein, partial [Balneolales bacterium]|nr:right-handed parallel beta-helix repeat-containing protein [Balneolales bacterium]
MLINEMYSVMFKKCGLALLILILSVPVHAQTNRYVATDGDDNSNDCSDAITPCATLQTAITAASAGDTIVVGSGQFTEDIEINTSRIYLKGFQHGNDGKNRSATESILQGNILIGSNADSTVIDGFNITEGASILGSKAGIYIQQGADYVTIRNNVFFRSGTVDGDGYRGVLLANGVQTSNLVIETNNFSGWATGIYLNPGGFGSIIQNNNFDDNYVGMSADGPDSVVVTGNLFSNNGFEGLGLGPWSISSPPDKLTATITGNEFTGNTSQIGMYLGTTDTIDVSGNTFEGVDASTMTLAQLLDVENTVGHAVDNSGGYSGYAVLKANHVFVTDGNSIVTGLGYINANDTLVIGDGTYDLSTSQLLIDIDDIAIIGESESGTIIDATDVPSSAGVLISSDGVSIQQMTINGPSANTFGLKFSPTTDDTTKSYSVKNVTVVGSGRTEIDLIGVVGAVLDNVTADGNDTGGVGIAITDSRNIELTNITTLDNQWGGIGIFTAGRFADGGTSNVSISGTNSLGESNPIYAENDVADDDSYFTITDLTLNGFEYTVQNNSFRSDATEFTFFQSSEANAISFALSLTSPDSSIIRQNASGAFYSDSDGDVNLDADGDYIVGAVNDTTMSIKAALGVAVSGNTINIRSGSYSDSLLTIEKEDIALSISAGVSGIDTLVLGNSINDFSFSGNDSTRFIQGNSLDNTLTLSGANNTFDGGTGSDTIVLFGNRSEYIISDNSGTFSFAKSGSENNSSGVEFATFDDITISLSFADPVSYPGRSLAFGDNSSTLSIPDDNSLDATTALSIEFWMRTSGFSTSGQSIIQKGSDAWSIHRYADTNFLAFTTYHSSTGNTLFGDVSITDGNWHHIAVVFDGSNKSIFIDGKLDASTSISGNLDTNSEAITVGGWTGSIDELRFWDTASDSTQIRNNGFQPLKGDESGLQGYWRMDEGSGSLVGDLTSNSNDTYIPANASISWNSTSHPIGTFITGDEGWRILTSPADGITYGELLDGVWTQGFTGADSESGTTNVFTYTEGDGDQDASSRGFQSITSASTTTTAGQPVLVYVYEDDEPETAGVQGGFPKTIQTDSAQYSGTITPSLTLTKSGVGGTYDSANDGWNLVGNPFASSIDWDEQDGWNRAGLDNTI